MLTSIATLDVYCIQVMFWYIVDAQERRTVVTAHPGQDVKLMCTLTADDSNQTAAWIINHVGPYSLQQLRDGILTGYSTIGSNLIIQNIMINDDRNDTEYRCVIVWINDLKGILEKGDTIFLFVMGEYQHCGFSYIASWLVKYIAIIHMVSVCIVQSGVHTVL